MRALFYKPQPVVEIVEPNLLVPAHPLPRSEPQSLLGTILGAGDNLIGNWLEEHYHSGVDSFRILGRQVVLANGPEAVRHVMVTHNDLYERKSPQMRRALEFLLGDGLFISDGEVWRRRRPLVSGIVHKSRLPVFAPTMEAVAAGHARRWHDIPRGTAIDCLADMAELTAEIIAQTVFGRRLGSAAAGEVISGFTEYQSHVDSFNLGYFLGFDDGLAVARSRRVRRAAARVHAVIDGVVARHLAGEGDEGSIVGQLLEARRADGAVDIEGTRNEAATIFMAGHETTASTLTWAWYCLARAPWAEAALHEELERVLAGRQPRMADVPRLAYARAVIEETLRLYPPVPILPRQASCADRIGDVDVERAALVLVVPWLIHRARDLWSEPDRFQPARFLTHRPQPYVYLPFAVGPRICAGLAFGLSEAILCLATLAQQFRVRLADGVRVEPVCRLTLRPRGGLPVTIEPR